MNISVIICTYEREDYLKLAIESLIPQKVLEGFTYEIIVVDNSPAGTALKLVESIKSDKLKYFNEKKVGLSYARNRGIRESKGAIIAFLDDDGVADENWLTELCKVYNDNEDAVCVGGRVDMLAPHGVDISWIPEDFLAYLSILDFGDKLFYAIDHTEYPIGVNISFKKQVFETIGVFNTGFGRKGTSLLSCEDSEYCFKIQKEMPDSKIYYNPKAIVKHNVLRERLTKEWFLKRLYWQGISEALFEQNVFGTKAVLRRLLNNLIGDIPLYIRRYILAFFKKDAKFSFFFKGMLLKELGYVQQGYYMMLTKRTVKK